jgi:hypothetical protein
MPIVLEQDWLCAHRWHNSPSSLTKVCTPEAVPTSLVEITSGRAWLYRLPAATTLNLEASNQSCICLKWAAVVMVRKNEADEPSIRCFSVASAKTT